VLTRFLDPQGALFSTPSDHDPLLLLRAKEEGDNVEPSAASVAAFNLLRLSRFLGRDDFRQAAERMIQAHLGTAAGPPRFSRPERGRPSGRRSPHGNWSLSATRTLEGATRDLLKVVSEMFLPELTVILVEGPENPLVHRLSFLKAMRQLNGKPTAYFCHNFACQSPVTTAEELRSFWRPHVDPPVKNLVES
jgi:uncharacterized protein YyaL (SSP411 family)